MKKKVISKLITSRGNRGSVGLVILLIGALSLSCGNKPGTQDTVTASGTERLAAVQELNLPVDNRFWTLDPQKSTIGGIGWLPVYTN